MALLHETVVVELGDRHLDDLLTIADPLVVTDLPTLLWSPHGHHEIASELLAVALRVRGKRVYSEPGCEQGGTSQFASKLIGQCELLYTTRSRTRRPAEWRSSATTI